MSATIPPLPLSAYQPPCLSANLPINHEDNHDNLAIMQPHLQPVSYHSYQPSFLSAIIPHHMPRFWSLMFYFSGGLGCDKNNCNSWSFSTWSISLIINYWNPNKQFDMAQFLWIPFTMNPHYFETPLLWIPFTLSPHYFESPLLWIPITLNPLYFEYPLLWNPLTLNPPYFEYPLLWIPNTLKHHYFEAPLLWMPNY